MIAGKQLRINKLNYVLQRGQDLVARPRLFLNKRDAHLKQQIDNAVASVYVSDAGEKYQFSTSTAFGPEIYQQRRDLIDEARDELGISRSAASGTRPPGADSGIAIREVADREIGRFAIQALRYEQALVDLARLVIDVQKDIGNRQVTWRSRNLAEIIDWKDVDLDADRFEMSVEAASILSRTPAGRLQAVVDLAQANLLKNQDEARRLVGHPDLEREGDLSTAALENIEFTIALLEDEERDWPVPEMYQDLRRGVVRVQQHLLLIAMRGAPESVRQRFMDWLNLANRQIKIAEMGALMAQQAVAVAQAPEPIAPGTLPVPPNGVVALPAMGG